MLNAIALPTATVFLPKAKLNGQFLVTSIDPFAITGVESSTFSFKGKIINGAKVFTARGSFNVTADAMEVSLAQHAAKMGIPSAPASIVHFPEYATACAKLSAFNNANGLKKLNA